MSIGHKGLCIGKTEEGEAVLVKGAVPGDLIDFQMRKKRNGMKWGAPINFIEYSSDRVEPVCNHFEHCGGCSWQNLDYAIQAEQKQAWVHQTIRRIGHVEGADLLPILAADRQLDYRNKMVFSFSRRRWMTPEEVRSGVKIEESGLGFYAGGSFDKVINIHQCHLQDGISNDIRNATRDWALDEGWTFYDAKAHKGDLRNLMVRTTRDGQVMVMLVTGIDNQDIIDSFSSMMSQRFPQVEELIWMVNTKWNDSWFDLDFEVIKGNGYITESLDGVKFQIGPKSFFQTNPYQAEVLFREVKALANLKAEDCLYDLYCGVGSIGLYLASEAGRVVGIEEVSEAIDDARINAGVNAIENAHFEVGDVKVLMDEEFLARHGKPDVIVTDPPRAGMHEDVVKTLNAHPVPRMVYVSCNPATQARDLQRLSERYEVVSVQPVDMFPHTNHVESIALLKQKS